MTTADFRDGPRLLLLLQSALAASVAGCVSGEEVVSVPWRGAEQHLVLGEPVSAQTCRAICLENELLLSRGGRVHLGSDKCELTRVEMSSVGRRRGDAVARVACAAHDAHVRPPYRTDRTYVVRLPGNLLERAVEGRLVPLETNTCRQLCVPAAGVDARDVAFEDACSILPVVPPAPVPSDRVFVVCTYGPNNYGLSPDGPADLAPPPDTRYQGTPSLLHLPSGRVPVGSAGVKGLHSERDFAVWTAYYEALSISAFRRLANDLREQAAPSELVAQAQAFARDEARHTRLWLDVALDEQPRDAQARRKLRAQWPARARSFRRRSAAKLALDNAVEGCVGESYGVWLALHQAQHATNPQIRQVAAQIARDEAEHAAFSFRLHDWLQARLTRPQKRALHKAVQHALDGLSRPLPIADLVRARVGAPDPAQHAALVEPLRTLTARGIFSRPH